MPLILLQHIVPTYHFLQGVEEGWYDGGSIAFAVVLVIVVTGIGTVTQHLVLVFSFFIPIFSEEMEYKVISPMIKSVLSIVFSNQPLATTVNRCSFRT